MSGHDNKGFKDPPEITVDDEQSGKKVTVNFDPQKDTVTEVPVTPTKFCQMKSVLTFTIVCGVSYFFYGLVRSIMMAQMLSFERQFGLSSSFSGLMNTASSIGTITTSLLAAHLARTVNIPRTVGISGIITGLAMTIPGLLYFVDPYHMEDTTFKNGTMMIDRYTCNSPIKKGGGFPFGDEGDENRMAYYIILGVMIVQGMMMPLRFGTLPTIFIDNNITDKTKIGIYMGIMTVASELVGPIGEVFNGFVSDVPVDLEDSDIPPTDPRFVSAWWLGFLIFGVCTLLSSIPLLFLPRHIIPVEEQKAALKKAMASFSGKKPEGGPPGGKGMPDIRRKASQDVRRRPSLSPEEFNIRRDSREFYVDPTHTEPGMTPERRFSSAPQVFAAPMPGEEEKKSAWEELKVSLRDAPKGFRRLMTNPLWVLLYFEISILIIPWIGVGTFGIKYVIFEYQVTMAYANFAKGFSTAITNIIGSVLSSYICTRIKTRRGYLYLIVTSLFFSTAIVPLYWFFDCDNNTILGLEGHLGGEVKNITMDCHCDSKNSLISCGEDGHSYLSPCFGGCLHKNGTDYIDCVMLESGSTLSPGACDMGCFNNFIIYNVAKAMSVFFYQLSMMPRHLLSLRITQPEDRAFAHTLIFFGALVVSIPAPIIFGQLLDTGCMIWTGQCAYYDRELIRDIVIGADFGTHAFAMLIYILMIFVCLHQDVNNKKSEGELPDNKRPQEVGPNRGSKDGLAHPNDSENPPRTRL